MEWPQWYRDHFTKQRFIFSAQKMLGENTIDVVHFKNIILTLDLARNNIYISFCIFKLAL